MEISTLWLVFNNPFTSIAVALLGGWIILRYFVPRSTAKGAMEIVKRLKKDPEIEPIIKGARDIIRRAKPFVENLDKIKPEDIDALINALKEFTSSSESKVKLNMPKKKDKD